MTRSRATSVAVALALSLAFAGTAFAKGPHVKAAKHVHPDRATAAKQLKTAAAPWLKAKANAAQLGGFLRLNVVVHAAKGDRPENCSAIVHFGSGDVPADLIRSGGGSAYHAAVPVTLTETPGPVSFDANCAAGEAAAPTALSAIGWGKIQAGGTATEAADAAEAAETAEAPESPDADNANVVVPDLARLTQEQRQELFDQLVALLARLLGLGTGGSTA